MVALVTKTLIVRFAMDGDLCWLSHRQTSAMLTRSLVRAGIDMVYSQGYNPRPRLSLPLPRAVGVRSTDELLLARVNCSQDDCCDDLGRRIAEQVPGQCRIDSVELMPQGVSFIPQSAQYVLSLVDSDSNVQIEQRIEALRDRLAQKEPVIVSRVQERSTRDKDVGGYIESIEQVDDRVIFQCKITPQGTVRADELLQLLGITAERLASPVLRKSVTWIPLRVVNSRE